MGRSTKTMTTIIIIVLSMLCVVFLFLYDAEKSARWSLEREYLRYKNACETTKENLGKDRDIILKDRDRLKDEVKRLGECLSVTRDILEEETDKVEEAERKRKQLIDENQALRTKLRQIREIKQKQDNG